MYATLVYHTEFAEPNARGEVEVIVKKAEEVVTLCVRCGRIFNPAAIATMIKGVPIMEDGEKLN